MKLVIVSDIHGYQEKLKKVIELETNYDCIISCGDNQIDTSSFEEVIFVKGNCDFNSYLDDEIILNLNGVKFLILHGHNEKVKYGYQKLIDYATGKKVNVVLFGHTHVKALFTKNDILFINPGSLGYNNSYTIYEDGKVTFKKVG
ncbi:MAG: YfcE family phosphodiesterase [Acholeplasmatales bacterium]|jgi:putative phosphoesterase|nr:YfcE family phosphodiesterase [Acholeplasmatales bacterium]